MAIVCIVLNACSDSVVGEMYSPSLTNQLLSVSPKELTFSEFGESKTLAVSTLNTFWKFVDYPEWITITPNSGDANSTVTVTATQNVSADVTRTCVFYLQSTDPNWQYKAYVSATQKNAQAFITPSLSSLSFDAGSSTKSVTISSNVKWDVKCNVTWVTVLQTPKGFDVKVEENITGVARNATIHINGGSISENLSVNQLANSVSCSVNNLEFYQKGGTQNFSISSQTSWSAKTSNEWIKVAPANGAAGQNNISVTVDENPTSFERHGNIYIQVGNTNIAQISIVQKGTYLAIDSAFLTFTPQCESKSVSVSSNVEWVVSTSESWINLSDKKGNGDCIITISVEDNFSDVQRAGIVSINLINGSISKNINIVQSGVSISTDVAQMHFPYNGGTQNLNLDVNTTWAISSSKSWLSFSSNTGTSSDKSISVNADENTDENDRSASFQINASGYKKEVKVTQEGKYFYIDNDALNVRATANTISLNVNTSESWTAEASVSWLTVSPSSGNGNANISISIAENNTTDRRQGKVIFKPADERQTVVTITQSSKTITTSPSSVKLDYTGATQKVNVVADGKYSATTATSWIKISNVTSSGFEVSATEINETGSSRSGSITLTLDGTSINQTLSITQDKMPDYVDLGLPSGTKWYRMNQGATQSDELGINCNWSKACTYVSSNKQLPTKEQIDEFIKYCKFSLTINPKWNNKDGQYDRGFSLMTCTGPNGNSIVIPIWEDYVYSGSYQCLYWSSDKSTESGYTTNYYTTMCERNSTMITIPWHKDQSKVNASNPQIKTYLRCVTK